MWYTSDRCHMLLQNVLKVFASFPDELMDIVKGTDPSTVTQHGLYMRPLGDNPPFHYQPPTPPQSTDQDIAARHDSQTATQTQPQSSESQNNVDIQQSSLQQQQVFGSSEPASPSQQKPSGDKWEDWHQPGVASDSHTTSSQSQAEGGWGKGRVTLLGDAAHATIPNGRVFAHVHRTLSTYQWDLGATDCPEETC